MTPFAAILPRAPDWRVDWSAADAAFPWISAMRGCPQDPQHHAEGDVWTHVGMVCEALAALGPWRALNEPDRLAVFAAALLHDVAKPECTRMENGRLTSRGHSRRGSITARRILWQAGAEMNWREQVCAMVRFHQLPFHLIDREDAKLQVRRISQSARCDLLELLAQADLMGRICADRPALLTRVALFGELCREEGCYDEPYPFPSPLSRFEYFRHTDRDPRYKPHDQFRCEAVLMSGLPAAGKDTWIERNLAGVERISLDDLRDELEATPSGNQGRVIQSARERARSLLRERRDFVWNATNLSEDLREPLVNLFTAYGARVRIVYVESPPERQARQNRTRDRTVPGGALERMMRRWEVPTRIEAPLVEWSAG